MGTPFIPIGWAGVLAARERMQIGPGSRLPNLEFSI